MLLSIAMVFLVACGNTSATSSTPKAEGKTVASSESKGAGKTMVVYYSATGTTKAVAQKIAAASGGQLYEIVPAQPYTKEDLNWNDKTSRSTIEMNDKASRPAIAGENLSLEGVTTMYIGYPIWWGEAPRILNTFVEKYNFSGIKVIPFATSGGSGIGKSATNLQQLAGTGEWKEGTLLRSSVSDSEIKAWMDKMK